MRHVRFIMTALAAASPGVVGACRDAGSTSEALALTVCGDGTCREPIEDCVSCPEDCERPDAYRVCTDEGIHAVSACGVFGGRLTTCGPCGCSDIDGPPVCVERCCGDGACDAPDEACETCPDDCARAATGSLACVDGSLRSLDACGQPAALVAACGPCGCDPDTASCVAHCCGDRVCDDVESCADCPEDCGGVAVGRQCQGAERVTVDACGRVLAREACGACGCDEAARTCRAGCCGDGVCDALESCAACPEDCATNLDARACREGRLFALDACGTPTTLIDDCGACGCDEAARTCRAGCCDGVCGDDEDCASCPDDCACGQGVACVAGQCVDTCGDGECEVAEDCAMCPDDCGCRGYEACEAGACTCALPSNEVFVVTSCGDVAAFVSIGCDRCDEACGLTGVLPPGAIVWGPSDESTTTEISVSSFDGECVCGAMPNGSACEVHVMVIDCETQAARAEAVQSAIGLLAEELDLDLPPFAGGPVPDAAPCP